jgi:hypothetical protein
MLIKIFKQLTIVFDLVILIVMSGIELKKWMKVNELDMVQVAALTKISPRTVRRFLDGESVRPYTQEVFKMLVKGLLPPITIKKPNQY